MRRALLLACLLGAATASAEEAPKLDLESRYAIDRIVLEREAWTERYERLRQEVRAAQAEADLARQQASQKGRELDAAVETAAGKVSKDPKQWLLDGWRPDIGSGIWIRGK